MQKCLDKVVGWFGSDVYERYTARYTWQSNQVAHAGMGFFGGTAFVLAAVALRCPIWWAFAFHCIPLLKDVVDFVRDGKRERKELPLAWSELIADMVADQLHWLCGLGLAVGLALAMFSFGDGAQASAYKSALPWYWGIGAAIGAAGLIVAHRHYGAEKRRVDRSNIPYTARFAKFAGDLDAAKWPMLSAFVNGDDRAARHVFVSGASGKTTLCLAIATELAVRGKSSRYISFFGLMADGLDAGERSLDRNEPLPPGSAEYVIVDDLDNDVEVSGALRRRKECVELKAALAKSGTKRRYVWVLSGDASDGWKNWVKEAFPGSEGDHIEVEVREYKPKDGFTTRLRLLALIGVTLPFVALLGVLAAVIWKLYGSR